MSDEARGELYEDMITRVAANPLARRVKLADLVDNMDPKRQLDGPEGTDHLEKGRLKEAGAA